MLNEDTPDDRRLHPVERLFARVLTRLVEGTGNLGLGLDPLSRARLAALDGKSMQLVITQPPGPARPVTIRASHGELRVHPELRGEPNVIVSGSLAEIGALLTDPAHADGIRIDGDEAVLAEFAGLLDGFEPDLTSPLSGLLGQDLAESLVGLAEAGIAAVKSAAEGAADTAKSAAQAEFLDEEEFARLLDSLDTLQLRVDRIAARVALAEQRSARPATSIGTD